MISFIVPAHNEAAEIGACLDAIETAARAGDPLEFETIVVDDASTDDTAAIAESRGARVVPVTHRQIAATRNAGAAAASGGTLIFVDADTRLNVQVLQGALAALATGAVGGGAGVRFEDGLPAPGRYLLPALIAAWRLTGWAAGCFVYCRRTDFEAVGGFDERYYASEEIHLSRALKKRGRFVVLKAAVLTSGRKFRLYSVREQWQVFFRLLLGGLPAARRRKGLELWYDGRREQAPGDPRQDTRT